MKLKSTIITIVVIVFLLLAAVVAFPGFLPPLRNLILDRWGWAKSQWGSPEDAWMYTYEQIAEPNLALEAKTRGSTAELKATTDSDAVLDLILTGPLGEQDLASGIVRRYRVTRSGLPDGHYKFEVAARRCAGVSGKGANYNPEACKETARTERFVVDTKPPEPSGIEAWLEEKMVIATGSAEDLAGLDRVCASKICVDAKGGRFELQVPLKVVNKHLRKLACISVNLIDVKGNRGEIKAYLEMPEDGWIVVDGEDQLRTIGYDDGGLGGNPPAWTVKLLEDGQVLEAFGTTPIWYYGVRIAPFATFVLLILSWRGRTVLIGWVAGLLDGLAKLLEKVFGTTAPEES